jgi:DNA-binding NarL/FixJ family response regulator
MPFTFAAHSTTMRMGKEPKNTVLIVDDSPLIIDRLMDALKDHEAVENILTATGYPETLEILNGKKADIILLDIQLSGKNGIDLLKFIAKEYPEIKVIMFSNLTSDYYINLCKKLGAKYFLDKSKDFELIPGILATI